MDPENTGRLGKFRNGIKYHVVDTTALLTSTNPIYSAMEVGISGMSDQVSIDSRLTVAALSYGGMGLAFAKGRDLSKKIFHVKEGTKERIQAFHDFAYTASFNLAVAPLIYLGMGASPKQAVVGGLTAAAFSTIMGPVMGYSIDAARDFTGIQENDRVPNSLRSLAETADRFSLFVPGFDYIADKSRKLSEKIAELRPMAKKSLAGILAVGSVALMAGIYFITPNGTEKIAPVPNQVPQNVFEEEKVSN